MKSNTLILIVIGLAIAGAAAWFVLGKKENPVDLGPKVNPEYQKFIDHTKKWLKASTGEQQDKIVNGAKDRGITYEASLQLAAEWYAEQQGITKNL